MPRKKKKFKNTRAQDSFPLRPKGLEMGWASDGRDGTLVEKMKKAHVYCIYADRTYYEDIMTGYKGVYIQIAIAKEMNKPVVLLIDEGMSKTQIMNIERRLVGLNVVKEITYHFDDAIARKKAEKELARVVKEICDKEKEVKKDDNDECPT